MQLGVIADLFKNDWHGNLEAAATTGATGVQLYAVSDQDNLLNWSYQKIQELRLHCSRLGLDISALCGDQPGHGFQIADENPGKIAIEKKIIELAARLHSPVVTCHIGCIPRDSADPTYPIMVEALHTLAEYALPRGVRLAIETGPEPAIVLKRFLNDVNSAGLGVNLDPANLKMVLNEDAAAAVELLGPSIFHTHAKDGIHYRTCDPVRVYDAFAEGGFAQLVAETGQLFAEVPLGQGQVDWTAYLQALQNVGYDGYLTIEREVGADPAADIRLAADFLRQQCKALGINLETNSD